MKYYIHPLKGRTKPFYIVAESADDALGKAFSKLKHHHFHIDQANSDGNEFEQVLSRRLYNLLAKDSYSTEMEQIIKKTMKEFNLK